MIGVMVAVHSDDKGLVLPPKIAPNQVIIIPIFTKENKEKIVKKANEIKNKLKKYNPLLDDRDDYSVGWKFNESELKGYPLRIEIGPKDIEKKQVVLVRRDTNKKEIEKITDIDKSVEKTLENLGFSPNEIKVYLKLNDYGSLKAGKIGLLVIIL